MFITSPQVQAVERRQEEEKAKVEEKKGEEQRAAASAKERAARARIAANAKEAQASLVPMLYQHAASQSPCALYVHSTQTSGARPRSRLLGLGGCRQCQGGSRKCRAAVNRLM